MSIALKFNVAEITNYGNGGGQKVILLPSVHSEENKALWGENPNGKIELHIPNGETKFEFGEYLVELKKAE